MSYGFSGRKKHLHGEGAVGWAIGILVFKRNIPFRVNHSLPALNLKIKNKSVFHFSPLIIGKDGSERKKEERTWTGFSTPLFSFNFLLRSPHSFSVEFSPTFSPILVKSLVIWIFYWIFANFFTNFGDIFGELKKLVSFWVTKMSPILVTIIPPNFVLFLSPILVKISVIWWNWWVFKWRKFHQFWWQ